MNFADLTTIKATNEPVLPDDYDELVSLYMEATGQTFADYCGRKFQVDSYTEFFYGGGEYVFPLELPIRQINKITVDMMYSQEDLDWTTGTILDPGDYFLLPDEGKIWSLYFRYRPSYFRAKTIKVEYDGGFDPIDSEGQDFPIPANLKLAYIRQIQYEIKRRKDLGLSTVTFKDGNVIKQPNVILLPQVTQVLDYYCNLNI